jgi:hypothetical protein
VGGSAQGIQKAKKAADQTPDLFTQVKQGSISLDAAYKEAQAHEKAHTSEPKPKTTSRIVTLVTHEGKKVEYPLPKGAVHFNQTNDFVGWARWTWNPVTGCLHGCNYCYPSSNSATAMGHPFRTL